MITSRTHTLKSQWSSTSGRATWRYYYDERTEVIRALDLHRMARYDIIHVYLNNDNDTISVEALTVTR